MKMIGATLVIVVLVILGIAMCNNSDAQTRGQSSSSSWSSSRSSTTSGNVRCVEDSFGNYTCSDGTRIIKGQNGTTIIPPKK